MKSEQLKLKVSGRTRIIRDIRVNTEKSFEAYYKNHFIHVWICDDTLWVNAQCTAPSGSLIVDGYVDASRPSSTSGATIEDGIKKCLENILSNER